MGCSAPVSGAERGRHSVPENIATRRHKKKKKKLRFEGKRNREGRSGSWQCALSKFLENPVRKRPSTGEQKPEDNTKQGGKESDPERYSGEKGARWRGVAKPREKKIVQKARPVPRKLHLISQVHSS